MMMMIPIVCLTKKKINHITDKKFLGSGIDKHLAWKIHIKQIIPMLSSACHAVRFM